MPTYRKTLAGNDGAARKRRATGCGDHADRLSAYSPDSQKLLHQGLLKRPKTAKGMKLFLDGAQKAYCA